MKVTLKPTKALDEATRRARHFKKLSIISPIGLICDYFSIYFLNLTWGEVFRNAFLGGDGEAILLILLGLPMGGLLIVQFFRGLILGNKWRPRVKNLENSYLTVHSTFMEGTHFSSVKDKPEYFGVLFRDIISVDVVAGDLNLEIKTAEHTYRCLQLHNAAAAKRAFYDFKNRQESFGGRGIGTEPDMQEVPPALHQLPRGITPADVVEKGKRALEEGRTAAAAELFKCALWLDSQCGEAYFGLFSAAIKAKTMEQAEMIFTNEPSDLYISCGYWLRAKRFASKELSERMEQWEQTRAALLAEKYEPRYRRILAELEQPIENCALLRLEDFAEELGGMHGYRDADTLLEN